MTDNTDKLSVEDFEMSGRTMLIAELGQAHDGSLGILHSLLESAAGVGVDAVKFQMHVADAESSMDEPFRTCFSYVDATRYDYWKRMELSVEQWEGLRDHCDELGVEFMATPFSNAAVDLLEHLGVHRYKIGSGDINNPLLHEKIARTGKEIIISTGLGLEQEVDDVVANLRGLGVPVAVMQCTTKYPTVAEDVGLAALPQMRARLDCPIGLSDHSGTIYAGIGAAALGAALVEVHVTFDKRMFGPDSRASLTVDELSQLAQGIKFVNAATKVVAAKSLTEELGALRSMFGKSLAVNQDLPAGHMLMFDDLEGKKPSDVGLPVCEYRSVIGRRLDCDKKRWDFLQARDLESDAK
jgi:N-acetylneuraminate synthase